MAGLLGSAYLMDFSNKERALDIEEVPALYPLNISDGPADTWGKLRLTFNPQTISYAK